ncbi:hypothetical protein EJB05_36157, partial [Eragrostis curvula]
MFRSVAICYDHDVSCCGRFQFPTMSEVDAEEHLDYSAGNIVIKFSATWCVPCRNAAPLFAELSLKHSDLAFVSVDVDELPELVTEFDIRATPTFIFMRDKKEIDKLVGGNQADLEKKFDPYCEQKD